MNWALRAWLALLGFGLVVGFVGLNTGFSPPMRPAWVFTGFALVVLSKVFLLAGIIVALRERREHAV